MICSYVISYGDSTSTISDNVTGPTNSTIEWSTCDNETTNTTTTSIKIELEEPEEILIEKPKFKRIRNNINKPKNRIINIKKPPGGWFFFKD